MFDKILIANRGEIACRIAATARHLGIKTVAVHSDADSHAKHVSVCDEAVHIGGSAPAESYLCAERILQVAKDTGAQAIHPGYGFLSENDQFADACQQAGLAFIGPDGAAIRAMGLKAESKRLMEEAGVPLVPGYHGSAQDDATLQQAANDIGYPVLIKASSGGGGKGMRTVMSQAEFMPALNACRRESINSFGNDAMLVEKYIERARHIEIQIFADQQGNCVYLFERDCSVQRRHQKVLEEAPAPGLTDAIRQKMGEAAVAAAKAVNYVGAGTVEFIVDASSGEVSDFYFMEMNTRLQVEHPVTEAITGLDLVEWQLRVAAGEPLPLAQDELPRRGHAIEARICAENPDKDFLPATGHLQVYRKPEASAFKLGTVRIDDGVREGDDISPFYDSMIAKLIVFANDRTRALARLDQALAQMQIIGVPNNVQFLRRVLATQPFSEGIADTKLIEREADKLFDQDDFGAVKAIAAAVAQIILAERQLEDNDPFSQRNGYRMRGIYQRELDFVYREQKWLACVEYRPQQDLRLVIQSEGKVVAEGNFSASAHNDHSATVAFAGSRHTVQYWRHGDTISLFSREGSAEVSFIDVMAHIGEDNTAAGSLTSPMPGRVVSFAVSENDKVAKGQVLAVIEAMKMEHSITAPCDGVVTALLFAPGDSVAADDVLLQIDSKDE